MNDTGMLIACIPAMGLYGAFVFQLHQEWMATGAKAEQERMEQERADIERRRRERHELLEWAESLPDEPEPAKTYARAGKEVSNEGGVSVEWDVIQYKQI